jgi:hypothetical protein
MNGVKNARRKFQSQLEPAASEAWYDRVRVGNVSPVRTQIPLYNGQSNLNKVSERNKQACTYGPHVVANPRMKRHAETIMTAKGEW